MICKKAPLNAKCQNPVSLSLTPPTKFIAPLKKVLIFINKGP